MHKPKHIVPTGHTTKTGIVIGSKYEANPDLMNRDAELVQRALLPRGTPPSYHGGARLQIALFVAAILVVVAAINLPATAGLLK